MSHLGRPKGTPDPAYSSLRPVAEYLGGLISSAEVVFCTVDGRRRRGSGVRRGRARDGAVVLLENTRFLAGETSNDAETAQALAALGDVFVSDAFGSVHRAHASTAGVAALLPNAAGQLLRREVDFLTRALSEPDRPFVAVIGGAKVSDKINVIEALAPQVDHLLIGGAMAYTFLAGLGHSTGDSLVESDRTDDAFELYERFKNTIRLPSDHVVADRFAADANTRVVTGEIPDGVMGLDIGPDTQEQYASLVASAHTVIWNGPMGVFELEPFAQGTLAVAQALADATADHDALTVVGGGDSVAAVTQAGLSDAVTHVSTGGGAMLELMEGKELPGLAALR